MPTAQPKAQHTSIEPFRESAISRPPHLPISSRLNTPLIFTLIYHNVSPSSLLHFLFKSQVGRRHELHFLPPQQVQGREQDGAVDVLCVHLGWVVN